MSKRPTDAKKRRRVAKSLRRRQLPAYFDLVQWMLDHDHARTRREARDIILAKRVRANSHILGVEKMQVERPSVPGVVRTEEKDVVAPLVSVELKPDVVVLSA